MVASQRAYLSIFLCAAAWTVACSSDNKAGPTGTGGSGFAGNHGTLGGANGNGTTSTAPTAGSGAGGLGLGGGALSSAGSGAVAVSSGIGGASAQGGNGLTSSAGGVAGTPNSVGGGTSTVVTSTVVWSWGQTGNEGPLTNSNWLVDNARGANEGATAAHPPSLVALTPVDLTIDCGAQQHSELSFYIKRNSSGPTLDLLVDGTRRLLFTTDPYVNGPFEKYVFDVPLGTHTYTLRAQSERDAATSFVLDSIVCTKANPVAGPGMTVDFDQGFVPAEAKGGWLVDNAIDTYSDGSETAAEAAIHPPALLANTPVDMTLDCGGNAHTELSFYVRRLTSGPTLDFLVDGARRFLFDKDPYLNGPFEKHVFSVPAGTHTYTFRAQSTSDAATSFVIDYVQCKNVAPTAAPNATIDFDKAFIPPETLGGWLVDNAVDTYSDGSTTNDEAAIHPPALEPNIPVEMTFDCGKTDHTELSFYVRRLTSGPTLDFLIDGARRILFDTDPYVNGPFTKYIIDVPQGPHNYTFRAQSTNAAATSFVIDFLQCKNVAPAPATNANVDFDKGFIPPEIAGGWFVDNVLEPYSDGASTTDEAAIRPPTLQPNVPADMTFNCGQATHSKMSFYLARKVSGPTLDILMDGTALQAPVISANTGFKKFTFDVTAGTHTYTFRAQSTAVAPTSFVVDFFQCTQ